jgi:hypothetical protein
MILQFDLRGELVGMYKALPKKAEFMGSRTHDIRRVIKGEMRTIHGHQWREVKVENLTNDNNTGQ